MSAPAWEPVTERMVGGDHVHRIAVPGGWLYRYSSEVFESGFSTPRLRPIAVVFVPDPNPPRRSAGGPPLTDGWRAEEWRVDDMGQFVEIKAWRTVHDGIEVAMWWRAPNGAWVVSRREVSASADGAEAPPLVRG